MNFETLDSKLAKGSQDLTLTRLYKVTIRELNNHSRALTVLAVHKLRVRIKSDSYKFQSYARIEIYNEQERKWNVLASIDHGNMETQEGLHYMPPHDPATERDFEDDEEELLRLAGLVLN